MVYIRDTSKRRSIFNLQHVLWFSHEKEKLIGNSSFLGDLYLVDLRYWALVLPPAITHQDCCVIPYKRELTMPCHSADLGSMVRYYHELSYPPKDQRFHANTSLIRLITGITYSYSTDIPFPIVMAYLALNPNNCVIETTYNYHQLLKCGKTGNLLYKPPPSYLKPLRRKRFRTEAIERSYERYQHSQNRSYEVSKGDLTL